MDKKISRRKFFASTCMAGPLLAAVDTHLIERTWLKLQRVNLATDKPQNRIVHFTDIHHKGDRPYLESVVKKINEQSPEIVCFTGDLMEDARHLPEVLEIVKGIKSPVYGVPGNHDIESKASFEDIRRAFKATGGAWLTHETVTTPDGKFSLMGGACYFSEKQEPLLPVPKTKNIYLMHYPAWVKRLGNEQYDLMLAGHSHGGQVRLPLVGALHVPYGVDEYDMGLFRTPSGPLYVNPGIGWYLWPARFNCRPEITVIEV